MRRIFLYLFLFVTNIFFVTFAFAQDKQLSLSNQIHNERLGTVNFTVTCNAQAQQYAVKGLALLHHMTYEGAREAFLEATKVDADCAMGYWGQAMSFIHPLWSDMPSEAEFKKGQDLLALARDRGEKSVLEKAYISAVEAYYAVGRGFNEKANKASFEKAWYEVYKQFPEDSEAASFYALAHMATADIATQGYIKQQRAAKIAKQVLARVPDHPGAHHYIIHAYDYPSLAEQAVSVARSYGEITSSVSHALHMPSHIFTRLGLWQESIVMNQRAATAALESPVSENTISLHYLHALDYLVYAYLQRADDAQAEQVLQIIKSIDKSVQAHVASAYAFSAVPARLVLERRQWAKAAALEVRLPDNYPWDRFPAMEAITHFARAIGAARSGNEVVAHEALEKLMTLYDQAKLTSESWAKRVEIHHLSAKAWLIYQMGKPEEALKVMRQAARLEAAIEKHPVTPGTILSARELLADMYLEMGEIKAAQAEYFSVLTHNPNRFNPLYGVARTAELVGDNNQAALYYKKLVNVAVTDSLREQLLHAKNFLEN